MVLAIIILYFAWEDQSKKNAFTVDFMPPILIAAKLNSFKGGVSCQYSLLRLRILLAMLVLDLALGYGRRYAY